jgi:hypothetical protein
MRSLFIILLSLAALTVQAGTVTGQIADGKAQPLAYASVFVKGSTRGVVANSQGRYSITLEPGRYTLVCQHVGYTPSEKTITVGAEAIEVSFQLAVQELVMDEVVIKRGEDPAIQIMREAIRRREYYRKQVDSFQVDVYIKGLMRSRKMPEKFFGQKIDRGDLAKEGIDSAGQGILFLSESQTRVSFVQPDKIKYQVLSSRQSGGGFGLSFPFFIDFYSPNVRVLDKAIGPRGFISPLADGAFHYYQFKYEGNFFEGNRMINRIRVTPKRRFEPLFSGYVQIVDGEWRIHSLELMTTSQYQLELLDTLKISQQHAPVTGEVWRTQNQVVYLAFNKFGFDVAGNFLNVYTNYELNPGFAPKHFDRIVMAYDSGFNRRDTAYWEKVRPVALEPDEKKDFVFKDSINKAERDSQYTRRNIDSLRRNQKPVRASQFLVGGVSRNLYSTKSFLTYRIEPLLRGIQYNTVEGLVLQLNQSLRVSPRRGGYQYLLSVNSRYGTSNEHFNAAGSLRISERRESFRNAYLELAGGKRVSQINRQNPIDPLTNALYTLLEKRNYMKLYENWFGEVSYSNRFESGLRLGITASYEDRIPLQNTTDFSFFKKSNTLLPNHPYELANIPFNRHQAVVGTVRLSFQPGQRYIQFPNRKVPLGSNAPTFEAEYSKGISGLFGSDADFDRWRLSMFDEMDLKIGGEFRYRLSVGGFLNNRRVDLPDFQHFIGNQTFFNGNYLNSFQLAPYYRYSNTERLYALLHAEHHFNGLLTNKIPLFNRLKWHLVGGTNAFFVNRNNYYVEAFAGIENIFKVLRVDVVTAYQAQPGSVVGVRVGFGGIFAAAFQQR